MIAEGPGPPGGQLPLEFPACMHPEINLLNQRHKGTLHLPRTTDLCSRGICSYFSMTFAVLGLLPGYLPRSYFNQRS